MPRYIQIDIETGIPVSDSYLSSEVIADHMISIDDDFELGSKKYVNGEWVEYEPEPMPEPELTQLDRIENTVNDIATNSTSWDAMASAINEGVNEV